LDVEGQTQTQHELKVDELDYTKRGQWLRAAILGANDGLLSTASLMMGVGAVRKDVKTMILSGVAGLVAGACSMAIGELVSVYSQYDIEIAQMKRKVTIEIARLCSSFKIIIHVPIALLYIKFLTSLRKFSSKQPSKTLSHSHTQKVERTTLHYSQFLNTHS
jgi:hypothetical protein